ncbi:MAG: citramalate synthase [Desulfovibrio sp.]|nr:citramalate synthase [Desulfovibrio sp.]MCA1986610.1 citramalate synthase [Desulfovibrio sp.]
MRRIECYDTTLRDGSQAEDIQLNIEDKLKIALKLDEFGMDYIEGGWPASNAVDQAFFKEIQRYQLHRARIAAFGSTHHPASTPEKDAQLQALIDSKAEAATIFGKTWDLHVSEALRVPLERNLDIIRGSVGHLRRHMPEVLFDAEHFFDGMKANPDYALACLKAAHEAGARVLVLCDTNGGSMPQEIGALVETVCQALPGVAVGIHCHNDCELAVANSLEAVRRGASHIQGTVNGYGERCGNANLCSIAPSLMLKHPGEYECLAPEALTRLTHLASYVAEVVNVPLFTRQPFVGKSAFAHKGGVHVSAVNRMSRLYEHIDPEQVGNRQRILLTELAGRSNIVNLARRYGFHLDKDEPVVKGLLNELKAKSAIGYDFAAAEASVELLLLKKLARRGVRDFFTLVKFHVLDHKDGPGHETVSTATVLLEVEGVREHTASEGDGPINALDRALRKALKPFYPRLDEMRLIDFKVRVLSGGDLGVEGDKPNVGSACGVRVLIESADATSRWVTVGVSHDVIEASWQALVDSVTYKLYKDELQRHGGGE